MEEEVDQEQEECTDKAVKSQLLTQDVLQKEEIEKLKNHHLIQAFNDKLGNIIIDVQEDMSQLQKELDSKEDIPNKANL